MKYNKDSAMNEFLKYLKAYQGHLTKQQIKTLKGVALTGDTLAVRKGLVTILRRQGVNVVLDRI